jgi:general secretion pathway protein G
MSHATRAAATARRRAARRRAGFSMIELVIVVVIIGIIAAIAIPRMSRGAAAAADSAVAQNLAILRNAMELYSTEHGNTYPAAADVESALTMYTKADGSDANAAKDEATGRVYGPYLRKVPALSIGADGRKNKNGIAAADAVGVGWIYNSADASLFKPNVTAGTRDGTGKLYSDY